MNRPLVSAFLLFAAGIISTHYASISFLAVACPALLAFILFLFVRTRKGPAFYAAVAILTFLLGAASYINFNYLPDNHISHFLKKKPAEVFIQGAIVSDPEYYPRRWRRQKASFFLRAMRIKESGVWKDAEGLSKVTIYDANVKYSYDDIIIIRGELKYPPSARTPGGFDYAGYLKKKRVYAIIDTSSDRDAVLINRPRPACLKRLVFDMRKNALLLINRHLPPKEAAVLDAMLLGRRTYLPRPVKESFIKTGTAHILSVSGLHVAVISAVLFFILRLVRIPLKASSAIVILFLAVYAVLAGARPPIIRAVIMIAIYLLGYMLERDFDIYSALSAAGIIILLVNPMEIFGAGFVLSFTCVFWICYLTPKLEALCKLSNRASYFILRPVLASVAVYIGIMPLIAYYFNIISPVTILANIIIVPFLGVVLSAGVLFIITGVILAPITAALIRAMLGAIRFFSNMPFAYFHTPDIPLYIIAAYYILLALLIKRRAMGLSYAKILIIALLLVNIFIWKACLFYIV